MIRRAQAREYMYSRSGGGAKETRATRKGKPQTFGIGGRSIRRIEKSRRGERRPDNRRLSSEKVEIGNGFCAANGLEWP